MGKSMKVDLCADCIYFDANGWDENTGRPLPDPKPMRYLRGYLVGPDESDHICEGHFSWYKCDGCGVDDGGTRYCYTAVK